MVTRRREKKIEKTLDRFVEVHFEKRWGISIDTFLQRTDALSYPFFKI